MDKNLLRELSKLGDADFCCLEHHLHLARMVRRVMGEYSISTEQMAAELHVEVDDMKAVITGAYPFDLMFISHLEAYRQHLFNESQAYKKETEVLEFADYKYERPIWMNMISDFLQKLNSEQKPEVSDATEADSSTDDGKQILKP